MSIFDAPRSTTRYQVQRLDGYTGNRPSWMKMKVAHTPERAEVLMKELCEFYPKAKFRIRKITRKS